MVEVKSSGVSGSVFDGLEKTTKEIINKFTSLQLILIKKQGECYPHETFEEEIWVRKSDVVARVNELLKEQKLLSERIIGDLLIEIKVLEKNKNEFLEEKRKELKGKARHGDVGGEVDVLVIKWKDIDEVLSQEGGK